MLNLVGWFSIGYIFNLAVVYLLGFFLVDSGHSECINCHCKSICNEWNWEEVFHVIPSFMISRCPSRRVTCAYAVHQHFIISCYLNRSHSIMDLHITVACCLEKREGIIRCNTVRGSMGLVLDCWTVFWQQRAIAARATMV